MRISNTLAQTVFGNSPLPKAHFGFKTQDTFNKPFIEKIVHPLQASDLKAGKLEPNMALVCRIVDTLLEKGFEKNQSPRAMVVSNVGAVLKDSPAAQALIKKEGLEMAVYTFQKNLIKAVKAKIDKEKGGDFLNPYNDVLKPSSFFFDGFFPNWGFWDAFKKTYEKFQKPFVSTKYPHFDMGQPITCTAYGPVKGLNNISIQLFDASHLTSDENVELKNILAQKNGRRVPTLQEKYLSKLTNDYCLTLGPQQGVNFDDWNILIFDNRVEGGLMHGATQPTPSGPVELIQRPMHQIVYDLSSESVKKWLLNLGLKANAGEID